MLSLTADGRRLRYAASAPGSLDVNDLVVGQDGAAYLVGRAGTGFPVSDGAYDAKRGTLRSVEGYVAKLSPSGSALAWSTFLGSTDFPTTAGAAYATAPQSDSGQYGFAQRLTDEASTDAGGLDVIGLTESYNGPKAQPGDPLPGGWIQQLTAQGDAVQRFETPIVGRTVQVPGGAIVGIGHLAGGATPTTRWSGSPRTATSPASSRCRATA